MDAQSPQKTADIDVQVIKLYEPHQKIYPRKTKGRYTNIRLFLVVLTQLFFFLMPWVNLNGRQALLFDFFNSKFYLFGMTLWPQDLLYATGLLVCSALALFWWTAISGRVWCGYACPQTVYTEIMIWFDRLFEGDRAQQIKLAQAPLSFRKMCIKTAKFTTIILFCLWTGFSFAGFFTPIRTLFQDLMAFNLSFMAMAWVLSYAVFTFLLAYVLREQVCKHMCPYARFQSAMFDSDTLIISYDEARGEPRGSRKKGSDYEEKQLGSCIDCTFCVQVCPAGIDIRKGLQYECIGCAMCIDACNDVMDKMDYPRGLIRYTTEGALKKQYPETDISKRLLRPKVLGYGLIIMLVACMTLFSLMTRASFKVDVIKDPFVVWRENDKGWIENTYILKLTNTSNQPQKFSVNVAGFEEMALAGMPSVITVPPEETLTLPVRVSTDWKYAPEGKHQISFQVKKLDGTGEELIQKGSFIGAES